MPKNQQDLNHIKEWLAKEPHLPDDFDDFVLEKFIHSCYGSLEQTKRCIEKFCVGRSLMPEVYSSRDPLSDNIQTQLAVTKATTYKAGDHEILIYQYEDPTLETFRFHDILKSFSMQADLWIKEEEFLAESHIIVYDLKNYSLRMIPKVNIFYFREFLIYLLEGMPIRLKHIYVVNAPPFYDKLFALVKSVLPSDICNLFQFFSDYQSLYKFIDKKFLPLDYDGEARSTKEQQDESILRMENARAFYHDDLWKADLKKKPQCNSGENSMNGSFKTLCID